MNATKGYYSIIQYCPNLGRAEAANVGVLLFCPNIGFLKAITSRSNRRISRFFGSEGHDWKRINLFKRGLQDRLAKEAGGIKTIDDLQQFIALRANAMQITKPNPMKVTDPDRELRNLFEEIIGEPVRTGRVASLNTFIGEKLKASGLDGKIVHDVKVMVPVLQKELEVPFGFQNGRFNLIRPVRFGGQHPDLSLVTACKYAVEGRSLYDNPDAERGELQLVVVGEFSPKDQETPNRVRHVFDDYHVKLFKTDEISQLIDEIRQTGKDVIVA